jgi:hypothetical protein
MHAETITKCFILIVLIGILIGSKIKRTFDKVKACENCHQKFKLWNLTLGIKNQRYMWLCPKCDTTKKLKTKPPD